MNSFIVVALAFVAVAHAGHLGGGSYGGGLGGGYGGGHGSGSGGQQILIIRGAGGSGGGAGGSLTVAGPSHVIKTIHQVRTIDNGGQILSKSGGGGGQAKILIAQVAGTASVQQASLGGGHGGAGGWSAGGSAGGHGGWSAGGSGGW